MTLTTFILIIIIVLLIKAYIDLDDENSKLMHKSCDRAVQIAKYKERMDQLRWKAERLQYTLDQCHPDVQKDIKDKLFKEQGEVIRLQAIVLDQRDQLIQLGRTQTMIDELKKVFK